MADYSRDDFSKDFLSINSRGETRREELARFYSMVLELLGEKFEKSGRTSELLDPWRRLTPEGKREVVRCLASLPTERDGLSVVNTFIRFLLEMKEVPSKQEPSSETPSPSSS